jgi:phosphoglycolate phosphatase
MREGLDRPRIRGVCFDLDGTLADTDDALVSHLARYLRPLAPLLPGRDPHRLARDLVVRSETPANLLYALSDRLGLDEAAGPILDAMHRLRGEGRPHRFLLIPGVEETLARLHRSYPLAIVSSRDERGVRAFLDQFALTPLFRCLASARTCRRIKPHPAPLLWAAREMSLPAGLPMVGDTTVDYSAARAAGPSPSPSSALRAARRVLAAGADLILDATPSADILLAAVPVATLSKMAFAGRMATATCRRSALARCDPWASNPDNLPDPIQDLLLKRRTGTPPWPPPPAVA